MHTGVVPNHLFSIWNCTLREADTASKIERSTRSQTGPLIQRTVLCQLFMIHMHEWDDGKLWKNPFNSNQPLHLLGTFIIYHTWYIIMIYNYLWIPVIYVANMWIWYTATCLFLIFIPLHSSPESFQADSAWEARASSESSSSSSSLFLFFFFLHSCWLWAQKQEDGQKKKQRHPQFYPGNLKWWIGESMNIRWI